MSHQDTDGNTASSPHHQALKQALDWLVKSAGLSDLVFRADNSVSRSQFGVSSDNSVSVHHYCFPCRQFGVGSSLLLPLHQVGKLTFPTKLNARSY